MKVNSIVVFKKGIVFDEVSKKISSDCDKFIEHADLFTKISDKNCDCDIFVLRFARREFGLSSFMILSERYVLVIEKLEAKCLLKEFGIESVGL